MQRMVGLGFALLALAGPVAAQTPVGVRESVNGALEAGDRAGADGRLYDCYRLPADPDRWLAASLMSQDFDAVLGAGQGPSCGLGETIGNDDSGTGPTPASTCRPVKATGSSASAPTMRAQPATTSSGSRPSMDRPNRPPAARTPSATGPPSYRCRLSRGTGSGRAIRRCGTAGTPCAWR